MPKKRTWLKPWGEAGNQIPADMDFSQTDGLDFSKQKPDIQKGDIVIVYAVGHRKITSMFQAKSGLKPNGTSKSWMKRWPWYIDAKNLTPELGAAWNDYLLNPFSMAEVFNKKYKGIAVTSAGGKNLNSIQYGKTALLLSNEFGEFLEERILRIPDKGDPELDLEEPDFGSEGNVIEITTEIRKRNQTLKSFAKATFGTKCVVCGFDFEKAYGSIGKGFIEVHHKKLLSKRKGAYKPKKEDVTVVCANCHRMLHRKKSPLQTSTLKKLVRVRFEYLK